MKVYLLWESTGDSWFPPKLCDIFATAATAVAKRDEHDPGPFDDEPDSMDPMRRFWVTEREVLE